LSISVADMPLWGGNKVFHSRDAQRTYDFLEETGTTYIYITDEMLDSMFARSDEGILFLLPNTERFVLLGEREDSTLWYYIKRR